MRKIIFLFGSVIFLFLLFFSCTNELYNPDEFNQESNNRWLHEGHLTQPGTFRIRINETESALVEVDIDSNGLVEIDYGLVVANPDDKYGLP